MYNATLFCNKQIDSKYLGLGQIKDKDEKVNLGGLRCMKLINNQGAGLYILHLLPHVRVILQLIHLH